MSQKFKEYKSKGRRGYLASILFHLLLFNILIITFPTDDGSHKPIFVFLGSILENEEIVNLNPGKALHPLRASETPLTVESRLGYFFTEKGPDASKPKFSNGMKSDSKTHLKSTFLDTVKEREEAVDITDLGINPDIAPRAPLKLDDR